MLVENYKRLSTGNCVQMDAVIQELQQCTIQTCEPRDLTSDEAAIGLGDCSASVFVLPGHDSALFNWRNIARIDQCIETLRASGIGEDNVMVQLNFMIFRGRSPILALPRKYYDRLV